MTEEEIARLEHLLNGLTRPMFNWRMSRALLDSTNGEHMQDRAWVGQRRGARTRYMNALTEMEELIVRYAQA